MSISCYFVVILDPVSTPNLPLPFPIRTTTLPSLRSIVTNGSAPCLIGKRRADIPFEITFVPYDICRPLPDRLIQPRLAKRRQMIDPQRFEPHKFALQNNRFNFHRLRITKRAGVTRSAHCLLLTACCLLLTPKYRNTSRIRAGAAAGVGA